MLPNRIDACGVLKGLYWPTTIYGNESYEMTGLDSGHATHCGVVMHGDE